MITVRYCILVLISLFFHVQNSWGGVEGKLETNARYDNKLNADTALLEERGDFLFSGEGVKFGLSLAAGIRGGISNNELYQFYAERRLLNADNILKVGRFERGDGSGYYIVDGFNTKSVRREFTYEAFAGRYVRVEDYTTEVNDASTAGMDIEYMGGAEWLLYGRVGFQRIVQGGISDSINWCGRLDRNESGNAGADYEMTFQGKALPSNMEIENLLADFKASFSDKGMMLLGYEIYDLSQDVPSLRNNFYMQYGGGRERAAKGTFGYRLTDNVSIYSTGRRVLKLSQPGYSGVIGAEYEGRGLSLNVDMNLLYMMEESSFAIFMSTAIPLTPLVKGSLTIVSQKDISRTIPENRGYGFETSVESMLGRDIFLAFTVMHVWNSYVANEYLFGLRLSRYFHSKVGGDQ